MSTESAILSSAPSLAQLSRAIDENPDHIYTGSSYIQNAALQAAKFIFDLSVQSENMSKPHLDTLFASINPSEAPKTRSQTRKRKRSPSPPAAQISFQHTPVESLYVDGMDEDQIWSQLDLRTSNICQVLDSILDKEPDEDELDRNSLDLEEDDGERSNDDQEEVDQKLWEVMRRINRGEDVDLDELGLDESMKNFILNLANDDDLEDSVAEGDSEEEEQSGEGEENAEENALLRDPSSDSGEEDEPRSLMDVIASRKNSSRGWGHPELDDDFFDLNAFNAQTEQVEAKNTSFGHLNDEDDEEEDENIDLFAPVDLEGVDEEDSENNASMVFYNDFFKPPKYAKQPVKPTTVRFRDEVRVRKIEAKGKNLPVSSMYEDEEDEDEDEDEGAWIGIEDEEEQDLDGSSDVVDGNREEEGGDESDGTDEVAISQRDAISRVKDDLFADEENETQEDLSSHERRMADLSKQIAELEAENVGPKDWVLMGEADSRSRPQNSLLEEDLEFDRVMKAVPVITEDVVKGLEERIKARILENRFDDVVRIRPLDDKPFLSSRFFELKDTKSTQSLAEIYEDEYVAATGGVTGEDRDGKLKKEHEEVERLWENICNKLDALCNAHFTPKQPKATISTISNVSTASMESTLPTAKSVSSMLAPEEVFASSPSDLRARSELTPAEKQALRRRERKTKKKTRDALNKSTDKYARVQKGGSLKRQKEDALKSVVKAGKGITVVGKKKKDILAKDRKIKAP